MNLYFSLRKKDLKKGEGGVWHSELVFVKVLKGI